MFRLWRGCVCVNPLFLWALLSSRKIVLNREEHNSKGMDGRNARKWMKSTKKRQPLMKTRTPWGNKNKDQRVNNPSTAINFIVLTPRRHTRPCTKSFQCSARTGGWSHLGNCRIGTADRRHSDGSRTAFGTRHISSTTLITRKRTAQLQTNQRDAPQSVRKMLQHLAVPVPVLQHALPRWVLKRMQPRG